MAEDSDLDTPIWGAVKFAPILRRDPKAVYYMLEKGYLASAVEQIGSSYVSTKRRLLKAIGVDA
jgi:hypothetical protein